MCRDLAAPGAARDESLPNSQRIHYIEHDIGVDVGLYIPCWRIALAEARAVNPDGTPPAGEEWYNLRVQAVIAEERWPQDNGLTRTFVGDGDGADAGRDAA
jgi:hypothetical protein